MCKYNLLTSLISSSTLLVTFNIPKFTLPGISSHKKLRIIIQSIEKGSYMTISTAVVRSLCKVLLTIVLRVHILIMTPRHVVHHLKLSLLLRQDNLLKRDFAFLVHVGFKTYSLKISGHLSNF